MQISTHTQSSFGYQIGPQATESAPIATESVRRQTYGSALLEKMDDKSYQAFMNTTSDFSSADRALAAKTLDRTAALSAANQYATTHDITMTKDLAVVYNFFENYQDVVSSDQIKHLLNTRLHSAPSVEGETFESEQFFNDFQAQLGGTRALDIRV